MEQQVCTEQFVFRPKAIFIQPRTHQQLKRFIQNQGGTMQEAADQAVQDWLRKREAAA